MALKPKHRAQAIALLVILLSLALYFAGKQIPQETIRGIVESSGVLAPVIFIALHLISIVFAPISGLPFLISGFYLFGETVIVYMYFSGLLGFAVNFEVSRKWGRSVVIKLVGEEYIDKIDNLAKEYGIITLIFLRLLWSGIADYASYAYGLTRIKFTTYYAISALASIPGYTVWYLIAARSTNIEQFFVVTYVLTFLGAGIFLLGRHYYLKKKRAK